MRILSNLALPVAIVVAAAALAACGGSSPKSGSTVKASSTTTPLQTSTTGSQSASAVQVSTTSCTNSKSAKPASGCVFVLTDGRRFGCPLSFGHGTQTPDSLARAKACHMLRPLAIPASWRPVIAAIARARSCLTGHGLQVTGGPSLGSSRSADTPIGELEIANPAAPPVFVGFYVNPKRALEFERTSLKGAGHAGQLVRHGNVIMLWPLAPSSQQQAIEEACAF